MPKPTKTAPRQTPTRRAYHRGRGRLQLIHYRVTLEDGQSLEVFKNMDHGGWYQRIAYGDGAPTLG